LSNQESHLNFNENNRKNKARYLGLSEESTWAEINQHLALQYANRPLLHTKHKEARPPTMHEGLLLTAI